VVPVPLAEKVRAALWVLLCAGIVFSAIRAFQAWASIAPGKTRLAANQLVVPVAIGVFCLATAVAIARAWKVSRWLGGCGGVILILYAVLLVFLGTEDVGGPLVSVPAGVLLAAFGAWNLRLAFVASGGAA